MSDGSLLDVTTHGPAAGPVVLLPIGTAVPEPAVADNIRAWGGDPSVGHTLAGALAEAGFRVVTADYEGHLFAHPRAGGLTAGALVADLQAVAGAAGADRFAYYGYSWLGLAGLQLAARTGRLTGLAMGGFPPLGGPYEAMLAVTRAAHAQALAPQPAPAEVTPGDWDAAGSTANPDQTGSS